MKREIEFLYVELKCYVYCHIGYEWELCVLPHSFKLCSIMNNFRT